VFGNVFNQFRFVHVVTPFLKVSVSHKIWVMLEHAGDLDTGSFKIIQVWMCCEDVDSMRILERSNEQTLKCILGGIFVIGQGAVLGFEHQAQGHKVLC
jgi:hypothetical protein